VIDDVKAGKTKLLVATDVAARGLDIEGLAMVVNYDLPNEAENYVHRIGRTARAGKTGRAITLASEQDVYELPAIERYIGKKLPSEIASAELHAEDSSAGQQVRTELYEDRREERHVHGKGVRPHVQNKGRGGHDDSRGKKPETPHYGHPQPGGQRMKSRESGDGKYGRHEGKAHDDSRGRKQGTHPPAGEKHVRQHEPQDLSHLSFEERMALYKQKYNKSEKPAPQKHPKPPLPKKPHSQKHPKHTKQEPITAPMEQTPQQMPEQKPAKKGILARLLEKIRKK